MTVRHVAPAPPTVRQRARVAHIALGRSPSSVPVSFINLPHDAVATREVSLAEIARTEVAQAGVAMGAESIRDAKTDEWGRSPKLAIVSRTSTVAEFVRPGPPMLDAHSWDAEPAPAITNESYHGRRRRSKLALGRFWVMLAVVVVALGAAASYPFVLRAAHNGEPADSLERPLGEMPFPGPTDDGIPLPTTEAPRPIASPIGNPPQIAR